MVGAAILLLLALLALYLRSRPARVAASPVETVLPGAPRRPLTAGVRLTRTISGDEERWTPSS
jgi:hypothetical protein